MEKKVKKILHELPDSVCIPFRTENEKSLYPQRKWIQAFLFTVYFTLTALFLGIYPAISLL